MTSKPPITKTGGNLATPVDESVNPTRQTALKAADDKIKKQTSTEPDVKKNG